jgi:serine protease Do
MRNSVVWTIVLLAGSAMAQQPPAPPAAPVAPEAPRASQAPVPPTPPRPPRPPRAPKIHRGSYLGVDVNDITPDRLAPLKLKNERGVEVSMVDQDAPAGKAGVKPHDVILSFNGTPVDSVDQVKRMIRETPAGRTVKLGISRDGQPVNLNVQLADRGAQFKGFNDFKFEMPPMPDFDIPQFTVLQTASRSGLVVENLTPQLGEFFGVKNGEGVLVRSVEKGSAGEAAGLRAGDVIVRVGNERVLGMGEWRRLMRASATGGPVAVGIVRDKREQTVSITLPQRRARDESKVILPDFENEMEELHLELEKLQPTIQKAVQVAQVKAARELKAGMKKAHEQIRQEMKQAQQDLEKATQEMQRELEKEK